MKVHNMDFVHQLLTRGAIIRRHNWKIKFTTTNINFPVAVVEAIRPIFRDISGLELLKKFLHGNTQNPNENINNVICSRVPKKTFVHLETLSFGMNDAIASFNKGNATKFDILKKLNIEPGYYAACCMERFDKERITRARYAN
ncbi:uncharacterized protein TNCV_4580181 [Trichonephila clavipes]|nr:uncharacterized protein TNCV_4580181 [Trichonephila clavipes]